MACMCYHYFLLCLLISQNSNTEIHRRDRHSGYGERCQCASVHLNRAGVLPFQYTHTHTRQTHSSRSKPDRFDMLSLSIPTGVCVFVTLAYNIIVYSYIEVSFNRKLQANYNFLSLFYHFFVSL